MARLLEELRASARKGKDLVDALAARLAAEPALLDELPAALAEARPPERGALMESLTTVTTTNPEAARGVIPAVVEYLADRAPRVRWEAARTIANIAATYPGQAALAVPLLLERTRDTGTVVRWSAAAALAEIAKASPAAREQVIPAVRLILERETNNGVRSVYLKRLKPWLD